MTEKPKILGEVLKSAGTYLSAKGLEHPQLLCDLLAARLLKCKPLELPLKYNLTMSEKHLDAMRRGIKRLATHEPVQYIIGQTEFMGHIFKTDRRALIPRPETEYLVDILLKCKELWKLPKPAIVELGAGTGCITLSIALAHPEALFIAIDISEDALQLARENAALLNIGKNVAFTQTELADTVDPETIDAIVANLPYISTADFERLPLNIKNYEPRIALDGGPDGLSVIEPAIQDASFALKPGGFLFLEIGETQAQAVCDLLKQSSYEKIQIIKDLTNRDRFIAARTPVA